MSYPTTRRFFRDDEFRNDNAAIAGLVRGLALWENHTWARDLVLTPADPKVHGGLSWPWSTVGSFAMTPNRSVSVGTPRLLARFPAPDPRAPANRITIYANVVVAAAGTLNGSLTITNLTTGEITVAPLAQVFGAAGDDWFSWTFPAASGDVLEVSASAASGLAFTVASLCAWWDPASLSLPGVTFNGGWSAMSQAYASENRPLSTHLLRWLGRSANAFVYGRPMPVMASWLYNPAAGVGAGYSTVPLVIGRYIVPVGAGVSSLVVRLRYRASGACSVTCEIPFVASATATISGAGTGVATATISVSPGVGTAEVVLTVAGSPTYCDIEHVIIYEQASSAADLALPSGETVSAVFDPNLDERLLSGRAIRADDVARLVANMVAIWGHRRCRVLVNDCRFSYREDVTFDFAGVQGITNKAALHAIPLANLGTDGAAITQVRVRAGWNACQISPTATDEVLLQAGVLSSGDYAGSTPVGLGADPGTGAYGQANWQHRWGGGSPGAAAVYEFETHIEPSGAPANNARSTRPSWLVLEQLPLNSPALTYP